MAPSTQKYRLVTRSDFDGLVSAVLLRELDMIDEIQFAHPKDMQDGKVPVSSRDITTNLPYVEGAHLVFDHHASETTRVGEKKNYIIDPKAPSAARVVYNHFGGEKAFPRISRDLMAAVDKADAAQFTRDEVLNPTGWVLLDFVTDARTGLGRFREFRVSNLQLMKDLAHQTAGLNLQQLLALPDVKERVDLYNSHKEKAAEQITRCGKVEKNAVVLDFRKEDPIYVTNRFTVYALFPKCNISIHVMWGLKQQNTVLAIGKSIIDRGSKTHVGNLCLKYGGGGHEAAGTCQVANDKADQVLKEIVAKLNADG